MILKLTRGPLSSISFARFDESASDRANWFGVYRAAVEAMLRLVGFRNVKLVSSP